jgi:hypothetical protein
MKNRQHLATILIVAAVTGLGCLPAHALADTVRDRLWIWGRPAGIYNNTHFRATGLRSTVEPVEASRQMGIGNMIFICPNTFPPPYDEYYRPFDRLDRVYWSLVSAGGGTVESARSAAFALAERHKNVVGFILDDFFHEPTVGNAPATGPGRPFRAPLSPAEVRAIRTRTVRGGRVPLMAVIYTGQVCPAARAHLAEVDQVSLWTWRPANLDRLAANFAALERLAPDKQLFLGCYMFNFSGNKPLPVQLMKEQVELGYQWLKSGRIAGMIFLSTGTVDVGLEAVDWTREWIRVHGPEQLPSPAPKRAP